MTRIRRWAWSLIGRCECRARLVYGFWSMWGGFEDVKGCINEACPRFHPYWGWEPKR